MLKILDQFLEISADYAVYDEVDSDYEDGNRIVGGPEPHNPPNSPPPLKISEPRVELRSFFPEGWLFGLETLTQTLVER